MDDFSNKLSICKSILSGLELDSTKNMDPNQLFELFTGYVPNSSLETETCSFNDFLHIKNSAFTNCDDIRKNLNNWYLNQQKVPKINNVFALSAIREETANDDQFFFTLARNGFVWKNIPGTSKAIFTEKYENIAKRLKYLIKMREYRRSGRHIVYLEDCTYKSNVQAKSFIGVSNKYGILSLVRKLTGQDNLRNYNYKETGLKAPQKEFEPKAKPDLLSTKPKKLMWTVSDQSSFHEQFIDNSSLLRKVQVDWVKEHILKNAAESCVFVFEELPLTSHDMIGPYTAKQDMKDYLDRYGVPYSRRAHRFELYHLLKTMTPPKRDLFAEVLRAYGHEYIEIPYGFKTLDFFKWFWPEDGKEVFSFEAVKTAEAQLIEAEELCFNEDRMMEEVIDKLMTLGKCQGKVDDDLTEYLDVIKYDVDYGYNSMFVK